MQRTKHHYVELEIGYQNIYSFIGLPAEMHDLCAKFSKKVRALVMRDANKHVLSSRPKLPIGGQLWPPQIF